METKEQSKQSRISGQMLTTQAKEDEDNSKESQIQIFLKQYTRNIGKVLIPVIVTAFAGTVTYPIAVRIARSKRLFKLRNFYAIHLAIAPFLAFIHVNIFAAVHSYMTIKIIESNELIFNN